MFKRMSFRAKITLSLSLIFVIFSALILVFQFEREKEYKKQQLDNTLNNIAQLYHNYIEIRALDEKDNFHLLDSLSRIIPVPNVRITVIAPRGDVWYDSEVKDYQNMENHLQRPEVQLSVANTFGANIRKSSTTGLSYYYYSRYYTDYFIRTAALYNLEVKEFLKAESVFFIYLIILFLVIWLTLFFVTKRFGDTIVKLKDFVVNLSLEKVTEQTPYFPDDELGAISQQIVNAYKELKRARNDIDVEKNKLFSHLNSLNEGVAFFTSNKEKILTNTRFIQYLNLISDQSTISAEKIFQLEEFQPLQKFIDKQLSNKKKPDPANLPVKEINLNVEDRYYNLQCMFFQDNSFEIQIRDTSKLARRRLLKQQLTSNIAHELKTPITAVLGYLETLDSHEVEEVKRKEFITKALAQAHRLGELVEDVSILNKIEETKEHFIFEKLNINDIVEEITDTMKLKLEENQIKVQVELPENLNLKGNRSLLSSIFNNLFDNAIKYGGQGIQIRLSNYLEDEEYYYFSFANTGNPIDERHFSRIFERFYRVDQDRSRKTGGTGLGLAIVKNAIQLHGGEISARNLREGGVEFLFTLAK
jgi:two-component system phosphate regulon sensor histidine kinase PhoR